MSTQARDVETLLRRFSRPAYERGLDVPALRASDQLRAITTQTSGCRYVEAHMDTIPVARVTPLERERKGNLVYLHGGGYVSGPNLYHWRLLSRLCAGLGMDGTMVHYRRAPEHPFPAALDDALQVVRAVDAAEAILVGDSAGAGLAVATALALTAAGTPPKQLVLFSPWLDVTLGDPEITSFEADDPALARPGMVAAGRAYAGAHDPTDPQISPRYAVSIEGLPPTLITCGTRDLCVVDARAFAARLTRASLAHRYIEARDMFHAWSTVLPSLPEAEESVREVISWIMCSHVFGPPDQS